MRQGSKPADLPPLSCLSHQERQEALQSALESISLQDRETVEQAANELVAAVKARNPRMPFSQEGALEAIAAVGIFLSRRAK